MTRLHQGLSGSSKGWLIASLAREIPRLLVVTGSLRAAEALTEDIAFFSSSSKPHLFPAWETLPFEGISPQTETMAARLAGLHILSTASTFLVVAPAAAVLQRVVPPRVLESLRFEIKPGAYWNRLELIQTLARAGYGRVSLVEEIGQFAVRGEVVDVFPSLTTRPIRIEFSDEEVTTVRTFDVGSQRSQSEIPKILIPPVREAINFQITPEYSAQLEIAVERIKKRARALEVPPRESAKAIANIKAGRHFPGLELLQTHLLRPRSNLFDFLTDDTVVVSDDPAAISKELEQIYESASKRCDKRTSEHRLVPKLEDLFLEPLEVPQQIKHFKQEHLSLLEILGGTTGYSKVSTYQTTSNIELTTRLRGQIGSGRAFEPVQAYLDQNSSKGIRTAFVVGSIPRAERLQRLLLEVDWEVSIWRKANHIWFEDPSGPTASILVGHLSSGFQLPHQSLAVVSEAELFGERSHRRRQAPQVSVKRLLSSLAQLADGDHIVHEDYGIGIYHGLKHLTVEGAQSDFLQLEYLDSTLYLPIQSIAKIQKFSATEGQSPTLDKLSSKRWQQAKQRVREKVTALAGDLIKLYAERSLVEGGAFDPVGPDDEAFADEFAYDETPDQLVAIEETLADMTKAQPMDRLVCGDVGFGKTEVALRAAYKALQSGRQVAMLAPTTLLVEQHKETFSKRFIGYPIRTAAVSRFYKPAQNKDTLEQVRRGQVDVIIGTHRLLQKDVHFSDLGLLIIDEEHRFGVKHKERLKQMRHAVDVLTLTATPIPRTLHMSLLGIRDISVIATPPHDRRLIRTYVSGYEESIVRDAILRELQRGGQCFFVHNRVQSIGATTEKLKELVPEARFEFGHGQMAESELEALMRSFLLREIDVFVTTTIIESGIDIPNANTIIIDRADTFGLAQLYQLRGRVGRSNRQAYAYLIVPPTRKLTADAQKRLKVLQSLDDLGLGFNLAIQDMEIRGVGNLLGKEQSGDVLAIGYELYSKILKEAVLNLKGEAPPLTETLEPEVKVGVDAYIPEEFIPDIPERLIMYQRLASVNSEEEAELLKEEIEDRFGHLTTEIDNLLELMRYRCFLKTCGIEGAEFSKGRLSISFHPNAPIDPERVVELVRGNSNRYRLRGERALVMKLEREEISSPRELLAPTRNLMQRVAISTDRG